MLGESPTTFSTTKGLRMNKDEEKSISDMYLAAAFLSYGARLVRIDKSDLRRQKFCFSGQISRIFVIEEDEVKQVKTPTLGDVEMAFINKTLMFPHNYPGSIGAIKSAIHANTE